MKLYAGTALNWSAVFLMVMAVLVNSPMLFYMATAILVTILAARLQAWLAVRYLRFERYAPPAVKVGEPVTVEIVVWSERELKRPLVTVEDMLPSAMGAKNRTPSLPVAPSFDQPIQTRYSFVPTRRGRYRWERLTVSGTDALGLATLKRSYRVEPCELVVYPAPLPVNEDIRPLMGWGASDLDSGRSHGAGLQPRGVREFASGDPIRYIHWRTSARRGQLMVKEFETGSGVSVHFVLQRTEGTDIGDEETSTFEAMCSHCLFLAADLVKKGANVYFPVQEHPDETYQHAEVVERRVREILTDIKPDSLTTLTQDMTEIKRHVHEGNTVMVFVAVQDPDLPGLISSWTEIQVIAVLYDPMEYVGSRLPVETFFGASQPEYIDQLERAGAQVVTLGRDRRPHA